MGGLVHPGGVEGSDILGVFEYGSKISRVLVDLGIGEG
jgi:hypothetical protein